MRSSTVKKEFGVLFKRERKRANISRLKLAEILGIAHQTIQSWEEGRSFISDLSIIHDLDIETGIYIPAILDEAIKNIRKRTK